MYVGYGSAAVYGILIPSFLVYLIIKQNLALSLNRRCVSWAEAGGDKKVIVHAKLLEPLQDGAKMNEARLECSVSSSRPSGHAGTRGPGHFKTIYVGKPLVTLS